MKSKKERRKDQERKEESSAKTEENTGEGSKVSYRRGAQERRRAKDKGRVRQNRRRPGY